MTAEAGSNGLNSWVYGTIFGAEENRPKFVPLEGHGREISQPRKRGSEEAEDEAASSRPAVSRPTAPPFTDGRHGAASGTGGQT